MFDSPVINIVSDLHNLIAVTFFLCLSKTLIVVPTMMSRTWMVPSSHPQISLSSLCVVTIHDTWDSNPLK